METVTAEVEVGVDCNECGETLIKTSGIDGKDRPYIMVEPCEYCLLDKYKEGFIDGRDGGC